MLHHVLGKHTEPVLLGINLCCDTEDLLMFTSLFFSTDAFDNELIMQTLRLILQGKTVQIPVYDFVTHSRSATTLSLFLLCFSV